MMTLQERLQRAKADLQQQAPRVVALQALTGLGLVRLRIQNQGLPGRSYSTTPVPGYFFYARAFNAGGRAYAKNRTGTYEGFRAALGLPSSYVNLTFTGRMWNSLVVQELGGAGGIYAARIVASEQESARVLGYNLDREGDFLQPNAAEAAEVQAAGVREIERVITNALNA